MIRRFSSHEAGSNGNGVDNKNGERKVERDSPEMNSNGSEVSSVSKVGDLFEVDHFVT
jgi:hypothetical protein